MLCGIYAIARRPFSHLAGRGSRSPTHRGGDDPALGRGAVCAPETVDSRLLSNFDPEGATGTRTAHQVITHHGGPQASGQQSWCGMAPHREMHPDRVAAQRRAGESRRVRAADSHDALLPCSGLIGLASLKDRKVVGRTGQGGPANGGWYPGALEQHVRFGGGHACETGGALCTAIGVRNEKDHQPSRCH